MRQGKFEGSVIDFFVVCSKVLPFVSKMKIDQEKKYILTNYQKVKSGQKATDSDHYTQFLYLSMEHLPKISERQYFYDFKDKEGIEKYRKFTSLDTFVKILQTHHPLPLKIKLWEQKLQKVLEESFKKIRKRKQSKDFVRPSSEICQLIDRRNSLLVNDNDILCQEQIQELEQKISFLESQNKRNSSFSSFDH